MDITDELIAQTVERFAPPGGRGTVRNILAFSRVLKELGVTIGLSQVIDSNRALEHVDLGRRGDFRAALRSNLVSDREQLPVFDRAFDLFWRARAEAEPNAPSDIPLPPDDADIEDGNEAESTEELVAE